MYSTRPIAGKPCTSPMSPGAIDLSNGDVGARIARNHGLNVDYFLYAKATSTFALNNNHFESNRVVVAAKAAYYLNGAARTQEDSSGNYFVNNWNEGDPGFAYFATGLGRAGRGTNLVKEGWSESNGTGGTITFR